MKFSTIALREDGTSTLEGLVPESELSTGLVKRRPALIICPGGGYLSLSRRESEPVLARFLGMGYQCFILNYPTFVADHRKPEEPSTAVLNPNGRYPEPIVDAMKAMAWVRGHAEEYGVDPTRVYMLGFSAGAHLTASLALRFDDAELLERAGTDAATARPDAVVLCYPMLSDSVLDRAGASEPQFKTLMCQALFGTDKPGEQQLASIRLIDRVRPDMPRAFIWHTMQDELTDPVESMEFASALLRANVGCELHIFEHGYHGMSLCDETSATKPEHLNPEAAVWPELAHAWLSFDAKGLPLSVEE